MSDDKKAKAATTNVITKFTPNQITEMKEAFTMIDQNRDGLICVSDLKEMYSNLGAVPQDAVLQAMIKEASQLNFTGFLGLFSDKLGGTDTDETLRSAFRMFDEDNKGTLPEEYLKDLLQNMGDNFTADEIRQVWKEAPLEGGKCDYIAFVNKIKGKEQDD